jgi:hypothetical protein
LDGDADPPLIAVHASVPERGELGEATGNGARGLSRCW